MHVKQKKNIDSTKKLASLCSSKSWNCFMKIFCLLENDAWWDRKTFFATTKLLLLFIFLWNRKKIGTWCVEFEVKLEKGLRRRSTHSSSSSTEAACKPTNVTRACVCLEKLIIMVGGGGCMWIRVVEATETRHGRLLGGLDPWSSLKQIAGTASSMKSEINRRKNIPLSVNVVDV